MTDLTPAKSLWKIVTAALTAFKKESYVGWSPQQTNAGKMNFRSMMGHIPERL